MTGTTPVVLILPAIPFSNNHQETLKEKKVYYWPWNLQGMPGGTQRGWGRERDRERHRESAHRPGVLLSLKSRWGGGLGFHRITLY